MLRALCVLCLLAACDTSSSPPSPAPVVTPSGPVRLVEAGAGEVQPLVKTALANAARDHRRLLVYVGATWCEPCKAFHAAAAAGELDATLPGLTLLEFDLDRDNKRLTAAGYTSELVPLFAVPGADGRASGRATSGAYKGGNYVAQLAPRIRTLLEPAPPAP